MSACRKRFFILLSSNRQIGLTLAQVLRHGDVVAVLEEVGDPGELVVPRAAGRRQQGKLREHHHQEEEEEEGEGEGEGAVWLAHDYSEFLWSLQKKLCVVFFFLRPRQTVHFIFRSDSLPTV